jgi:SAM-dependent methyltransferase
MDRSILVRLFGFPATLVHGDTLVLDRWRWLSQHLPTTANDDVLIDIGCGTGAFTIGAAKRGYKAIGLSWDERNQREASRRAQMCGVTAAFSVCDVRHLHLCDEYNERFDVAICLECIEHILDDRKLIVDIAACLKPGGRLLLTTPNFYYRAITAGDNGPFHKCETGGHVRRGYTSAMLRELCRAAGLICEELSYCGGFFSQKTTSLWRKFSTLHWSIGWSVILPLRPIALLLDLVTQSWTNFPQFSICMVAQKPRFQVARTNA